METYNFKTDEFESFIHKIRDASGGLVMSLIISPSCKDWIPNINLTTGEDQEFSLYGWYKISFPVYVDKTLVECMYLIGNAKTTKIDVVHGQ